MFEQTFTNDVITNTSEFILHQVITPRSSRYTCICKCVGASVHGL